MQLSTHLCWVHTPPNKGNNVKSVKVPMVYIFEHLFWCFGHSDSKFASFLPMHLVNLILPLVAGDVTILCFAVEL